MRPDSSRAWKPLMDREELITLATWIAFWVVLYLGVVMAGYLCGAT
jgi:hypothetical protein